MTIHFLCNFSNEVNIVFYFKNIYLTQKTFILVYNIPR